MVNRDLTAPGFGIKRANLVTHASDTEKVWTYLFHQGPGASAGVAKQHCFKICGLSPDVSHTVHGHHG